MKPIKFDLPLNGTRIATLEQLEENLTPEILEPFRSGKLAKWLRARSLNEQAEVVDALLAANNEREVQLLKGLYTVFGGETDNGLLQAAIAEHKKSSPSVQSIIDTENEQLKAELSEGKIHALNAWLGVNTILFARKKNAISTEEFELWSDTITKEFLATIDINELRQSDIFEQFDEETKNMINELERLIQL